jgi:hypothetical protein
MKTWVFAIALLAALFVFPALTEKKSNAAHALGARAAQRRAIKSRHILDRPNRPGHIYGNTVRRRYYSGKVVFVPKRGR